MVCEYPLALKQNLKPSTDMTKASTIFPSEDDPGAKAKEIRSWLAGKGVRDFEPVTLQCDQLDKVHLRATQGSSESLTIFADHSQGDRRTGQWFHQGAIAIRFQACNCEERPTAGGTQTGTRSLPVAEPEV